MADRLGNFPFPSHELCDLFSYITYMANRWNMGGFLVFCHRLLGSVFGRRFDLSSESEEVKNLRAMVEEGFQLLGSFN